MSEGKAVVKARDGLNVRSGAGTQYSRLGALANGTAVSYSAEKNGWLQIHYSNQTGYISKAYTTVTQAATSSGASSNTSSSSGTTMYTNANSLNVRKGPGTGHSVIGSLSYGSQVTVLGTESNGWKKISYKSGVAYISGSYVQSNNPSGKSTESKKIDTKPVEQDKITASSSSAKTCKVVVNGSLNIRSKPNTSCSIIGSLNNGSTVTYTDEQNGFLKITSPKNGYISKKYTSLNANAGNHTGSNDTGKIDTSQIGAGGLTALTTKQVAARDTGRKTKKIIDLKTKKAFNVSWDSCPGYHSDCTPMTPADTTVYKSIRNPNRSADDKAYWSQISSWSWDGRPAAIQLKDGTWVACGYHQRPHAAIMGGNPGHPFKSQSNTRPAGGWPLGGHFCLYYGDSPGGTPDCNRAAKEARNMSL